MTEKFGKFGFIRYLCTIKQTIKSNNKKIGDSDMKNFKETMREIMSEAWNYVRRNGYNMSEALKTAWANFRLRQQMKVRIVRFYFRKIDGSIREAWGTLAENLIPATSGTDNRRKNDTVQVYYDTEKMDWRCYKKANLLSIAA